MKTPSPKNIKSALQTPEEQLGGLVITRDTLQARQAAVAVEVETALTARRKALIEGGSARDIAEAERVCREIEGTAYGIADALAEVGRRIADTEVRIEAQQKQARSETVAAGLERNAGEIETATAAMSKALDGVSMAHAFLAITVSGTSAPQFEDRQNGIDSPIKIANAILLRGVVAALMGVGIEVQLRDMSTYSLAVPVEPAAPAEVAAAFGERLRGIARQIRAGETSADVPLYHQPEPNFTPESPETQVYVLAPFYYIGAQRDRVMVTGFNASLPVPVAERAFVMGLASDVPTVEWQKAQKGNGTLAEAFKRIERIDWDDCQDLDFDLAEWRRAEASRRRDAWLAEQGREAA